MTDSEGISVIRELTDSELRTEGCDLRVVLAGGGGVGTKSARVIKFIRDDFITAFDFNIEDDYGAVVSYNGAEYRMLIVGLLSSFFIILSIILRSCCLHSNSV